MDAPSASQAICILNNAVLSEDSMSGSDRRVLQFVRHRVALGQPPFVIGPKYLAKRFEGLLPPGHLLLTPQFNLGTGLIAVLLSYCLRIFPALILLQRLYRQQPFALYCSSDILPDAIPALFFRIAHSSLRLVMGIHLLVHEPFANLRNLYHVIMQRLVQALLVPYAHRVFVSNPGDREYLIRRRGFSPSQVQVTYGAVDFAALDQVPEQPKNFLLSCIARNQPQKGIADLLHVLKALAQQFPQGKFLLIGELEDLRPRLHELGLSSCVELSGFVDGAQKFKLLKQSQLYLSPSHHESFAMAVCEAMACGLPVVAYDLPVYRLNFPSGVCVVPLQDREALTQACLQLLRSEHERGTWGAAAARIAKEFRWERTNATVESALLTLP